MSDTENTTGDLPVSSALKERVDTVIQNNAALRQKVEEEPLTAKFYEALSDLEGDEDKLTYALSQIQGYDFGNVRHVEAFCTGICRRVAKHGTDGVNLGVLGEEMKATLERLISEGKFARNDLDFRVVSNLEKLSEKDRLLAVERYEEKLDDTINSKQGFLMGIVNRMTQSRGGRYRGKRHGRRGGHRGGDRGDMTTDNRQGTDLGGEAVAVQ